MGQLIRNMRKNNREILITVTVVFTALLFCCAWVLVDAYSAGLDKQAEGEARLASDNIGTFLKAASDKLVNKSVGIAARVPDNMNDTTIYLNKIKNSDTSIAFFRMMKGDVEYTGEGNEFTGTESPYVQAAIKRGEPSITGMINDAVGQIIVLAVYVPCDRSAGIDGLIIFYHENSLINELKEYKSFKPFKNTVEPRFAGVCTAEGRIFSVYKNDGIELQYNQNVFERIRKLVNDKSVSDKIERMSGEEGAVTLSYDGERYVFSIKPVNDAKGAISTICIYKSEDIYSNGFKLVNTVYAALIIMMLLTFALVGYLIYRRARSLDKRDNFELHDQTIGCPTQKAFCIRADEILKKNKITNYAVIFTDISHFEYISEHFDEKTAIDTLKFLAKLIEKSLLIDETFGRVDGSRFVILCHYRSAPDIVARLNVITAIANTCPALLKHNYSMKLKAGVYYIDRAADYSILKMIECAMIAERSRESAQSGNVKIFDDRIHETMLHEAEVELNMEHALESGEFKLFYQPKYSIKNDRMDGAEALVRWYDPTTGKFRSPAHFIPIFEANGFISKLDRYIFGEVCKFIRESAEQGYRMALTSVNVSRVTAIQPDFMDYYISTKKKYAIPDGMIMLEFTESFAYENYDMMYSLVTGLRSAGFKCSIDDFGSGYSSFNILKALPMDELKLDKLFLERGTNAKRDDILLKSVIELAKQLDMKVTQEGVETQKDMDRVRAFGCEVVQGYIYSKPLPMSDYIEFLSKNK